MTDEKAFVKKITFQFKGDPSTYEIPFGTGIGASNQACREIVTSYARDMGKSPADVTNMKIYR